MYTSSKRNMIISLLVLFFKIADDTEYPDFLRFDAIQKIQYLAGSVRPKTKHNEQSTGGQSLHSQRPKKTAQAIRFQLRNKHCSATNHASENYRPIYKCNEHIQRERGKEREERVKQKTEHENPLSSFVF